MMKDKKLGKRLAKQKGLMQLAFEIG